MSAQDIITEKAAILFSICRKHNTIFLPLCNVRGLLLLILLRILLLLHLELLAHFCSSLLLVVEASHQPLHKSMGSLLTYKLTQAQLHTI